MKQTAVEYLYQELWQAPKDKWMWQMILNQAKEIEKEQIEDAYDSGEANQYSEIYKDGYKDVSPNQYYIETYEKDA